MSLADIAMVEAHAMYLCNAVDIAAHRPLANTRTFDKLIIALASVRWRHVVAQRRFGTYEAIKHCLRPIAGILLVHLLECDRAAEDAVCDACESQVSAAEFEYMAWPGKSTEHHSCVSLSSTFATGVSSMVSGA